MNTRAPRFEIVRTHAGHHARYGAANGRIVWTTEVYTRRGRALDAIQLLADSPVTLGVDQRWRVRLHGNRVLEIRDVDERSVS